MMANSLQSGMDRASNPKRRSFQPPCHTINLELTIMEDSNMKQIPLSQGKFALVDDKDFSRTNKYKWHLNKSGNIEYAERTPGISMHRVILGLKKGDKIVVDHRNDNGLDNRRCNLRICSYAQNSQNQRMHSDNQCRYKGVRWNISSKKWRARIHVNGKRIHIGVFTCLIKAAKAYDAEAKKHFGEFARLNFPKKGVQSSQR